MTENHHLWKRIHDATETPVAPEEFPCKSVMCPDPAPVKGGYCERCQKEKDERCRQQEELDRIRREQGS